MLRKKAFATKAADGGEVTPFPIPQLHFYPLLYLDLIMTKPQRYFHRKGPNYDFSSLSSFSLPACISYCKLLQLAIVQIYYFVTCLHLIFIFSLTLHAFSMSGHFSVPYSTFPNVLHGCSSPSFSIHPIMSVL